MPDPITGATTQPQVPVVNATRAAGPDAATAGAIAQTHGGEYTSSTVIKNIEDLKRKAPKLYNEMMKSIGMDICHEMQHHQERLKQMMREANNP
jgi:hypothetical protein